MMRYRNLVVGALTALVTLGLPGMAAAWSHGPYPGGYGGPWGGYAPYGGYPGYYGYPGYGGHGGYSRPDRLGPGYRPSGPSRGGGLQISRDADQGHYYLDIRLNGLSPQEVSVTLEGDRWLAIRRQTGRSDQIEDTNQAPGGWSRGYRYSANQWQRRLSLPADADAAAMQREDSPERVRISFPRTR